MIWNPQVELLAQELKSLVGWGARRHCLSKPILRELVAAELPEDTKYKVLGQAIIEHLKQAAKELGEPKTEAVKCLLALTVRWWHLPAPDRRLEAVMRLGVGRAVDTFRREDYEEMDLMRELAEVLLERVPTDS